MHCALLCLKQKTAATENSCLVVHNRWTERIPCGNRRKKGIENRACGVARAPPSAKVGTFVTLFLLTCNVTLSKGSSQFGLRAHYLELGSAILRPGAGMVARIWASQRHLEEVMRTEHRTLLL